MQPHDQCLMHLTIALTQASRAYKSAADKLAADFGLSQATAWPVLIVSRLGDGVRPGMVADALGLEASSVVRVIDHVIEAGFLERHEDANDRRAKTLHLTAEGKKCAMQMEKVLIPFRRKLFKGIDAADIAACARVLDALNAAIAGSSDHASRRKVA